MLALRREDGRHREAADVLQPAGRPAGKALEALLLKGEKRISTSLWKEADGGARWNTTIPANSEGRQFIPPWARSLVREPVPLGHDRVLRVPGRGHARLED